MASVEDPAELARVGEELSAAAHVLQVLAAVGPATRQAIAEGLGGPTPAPTPAPEPRPDLAWSVPADGAAAQLRALVIDTGDDVGTVAKGIGVEPEWARGVLIGEITEVDLDHVQRLCEGLHCTPYDLFGADAGRSIAHAYGPELWPRYIEPLEHPAFDVPGAGAGAPAVGLDLDP